MERSAPINPSDQALLFVLQPLPSLGECLPLLFEPTFIRRGTFFARTISGSRASRAGPPGILRTATKFSALSARRSFSPG